MKVLLFLLAILLILFGIGSGIYFEFTDNSEDAPNWRKGFFRLTVVLSFLVGILGGIIFSSLAKMGKLADKDDGDPPPKHFTNPKYAFFTYTIIFFGFVWLGYAIIQWPLYYIFMFVLRGFTS